MHYPRLDTVLMIEKSLRKVKKCKSRVKFWKTLPRKVMYQTFSLVLRYLVESRKIKIKKDGVITWVFRDVK